MDGEAMARQDALEMARRIHAEHIVMDSLAPTFTCEMALTPAMVELARGLQGQGKTRSAIRTALAEHLTESASSDAATREAYLAFWRRAGVTAASCTLYDSGPPERAWDEALTELARGHRLLRALDGDFVLGDSAASVGRAHRDRRHAVIFNLQNAEPIGDQFGRIDVLYNLGVRILQVAYNLRNRFADGCVERCDGGLSRFGEALVDRLNRRRILIDLSHCSDRTAADVIAGSRAPVAFTHTSARAISRHARGKTDEALRAIADRGGYIGILIVPFFLLPPGGDGPAATRGAPPGWATLDDVVDHVLHALNLAGSDSVGIGTDWGKPYYTAIRWSADMVREQTASFDWVGWRPEDRFDPNLQTQGLETWDLWPNLTVALLRRGLPEDTVAKIVGGNFLRVFGEVCG
ncbi:MAG TPA: membrane dipeptidase [Candidatus Methylomirabilis sp.]|nr:membrane dipeptidase [Candidatus Methylomirabilis sp.]